MDQISVKYIGKRQEYTDGAYGTRIHFTQGESRMVPADKARLMLKHADVYEPGDGGVALEHVPETKDDQDEVQDLRDVIATMEKEALSTYSQTHFGVKLDKRKDLGLLRSQVTALVDQYGAI